MKVSWYCDLQRVTSCANTSIVKWDISMQIITKNKPLSLARHTAKSKAVADIDWIGIDVDTLIDSNLATILQVKDSKYKHNINLFVWYLTMWLFNQIVWCNAFTHSFFARIWLNIFMHAFRWLLGLESDKENPWGHKFWVYIHIHQWFYRKQIQCSIFIMC